LSQGIENQDLSDYRFMKKKKKKNIMHVYCESLVCTDILV